jgi:hypothetical protein
MMAMMHGYDGVGDVRDDDDDDDDNGDEHDFRWYDA